MTQHLPPIDLGNYEGVSKILLCHPSYEDRARAALALTAFADVPLHTSDTAPRGQLVVIDLDAHRAQLAKPDPAAALAYMRLYAKDHTPATHEHPAPPAPRLCGHAEDGKLCQRRQHVDPYHAQIVDGTRTIWPVDEAQRGIAIAIVEDELPLVPGFPRLTLGFPWRSR